MDPGLFRLILPIQLEGVFPICLYKHITVYVCVYMYVNVCHVNVHVFVYIHVLMKFV